MSDTLDRLLSIKRPVPSQETGRGEIVIEAVDPSHAFNPHHRCEIRVDGRQVAALHRLRHKASFEVCPGYHVLTVRLGPDFSEPLAVFLKAGEQIELLCGKKPEWIEYERRLMRGISLNVIVIYAIVGLCWFAYPWLRGIVAEAIYWFRLEGGAAALGHKMVLTWHCTACFGVLATSLPGYMILMIRSKEHLSRLQTEIGSRCFLRIKHAKKKIGREDDW